MWMLWAQGLLEDRQRAFVERPGLRVAALGSIEFRQVVEALGHVRVLRSQGLLSDRQRALEDLSDNPAVKARQIKAEKYNSLVGENSQGCPATDPPDYACFRKIIDCVRSYPSPNWQGLQRCLTQ